MPRRYVAAASICSANSSRIRMASSRDSPEALAGSIANDRRTFSIFHCWSRSSRRMDGDHSRTYVRQATQRLAVAGVDRVGGGMADQVDAGPVLPREGQDDGAVLI